MNGDRTVDEFLTTTSENLFRTVFEMQPQDVGTGAIGGFTRDDEVPKFII